MSALWNKRNRRWILGCNVFDREVVVLVEGPDFDGAFVTSREYGVIV